MNTGMKKMTGRAGGGQKSGLSETAPRGAGVGVGVFGGVSLLWVGPHPTPSVCLPRFIATLWPFAAHLERLKCS